MHEEIHSIENIYLDQNSELDQQDNNLIMIMNMISLTY